MNRELINLFNYDFEPFMLLEGGTGLNDIERLIYRKLVNKNFEVWSVENLYEMPERIGAIQFLKPKTIIFGTTGVYSGQIEMLFSMVEQIDISSVENVVLTLDTEREIGKLLKPYREKINFYKIDGYPCDAGDPIEIYKI